MKPIDQATSRELEIVQVRAAVALTDFEIARLESTLAVLREKQDRRRCEVVRQETLAKCQSSNPTNEHHAKTPHPETPHSDLLTGVTALTEPNFHKLNVHAGRNDRLLHAALCACAKHHLDCEDIGWNQLGDILHDAICNEIGDDKYCEWADLIKKE